MCFIAENSESPNKKSCHTLFTSKVTTSTITTTTDRKSRILDQSKQERSQILTELLKFTLFSLSTTVETH